MLIVIKAIDLRLVIFGLLLDVIGQVNAKLLLDQIQQCFLLLLDQVCARLN
jgi:hypothetical protein